MAPHGKHCACVNGHRLTLPETQIFRSCFCRVDRCFLPQYPNLQFAGDLREAFRSICARLDETANRQYTEIDNLCQRKERNQWKTKTF